MEKLAFIDLGSNSVRFIVISIHDNGSHTLEFQQKESVRLGEGLSKTNTLSPETMDRAIIRLKAYAHMATVMNVDHTIAVATAAVRNATNGDEFTKKVLDETGITLRVISGEEEAYLGFLGVINTIALKDFILFDLGGASVEISLIRNRQQVESISVPIGAVTLTERYGLQNQTDTTVLEKARTYVRSHLEKLDWLVNSHLPIVGIGGTVRTLAKIDQRSSHYMLAKLHNYTLTIERVHELYHALSTKSCADRKKISGLASERADIIVAGSIVVTLLTELAHAPSLTVGGCGLREGLFYDYYGKYYQNNNPILPDILQHSTYNFLRHLGRTDLTHNEYVTKLALKLYDGLSPILKIKNSRLRVLLKTAALLHDVGTTINFYNHARHSAFMIAGAPLYGLTQGEQLMTSFIAGYHHGISSKILRAYRYSALLSPQDWEWIRKLGVLLYLAETLDTTYEQIVHDLTFSHAENVAILLLETEKKRDHLAIEGELQKVQKQFKKEFSTSLIIIWK